MTGTPPAGTPAPSAGAPPPVPDAIGARLDAAARTWLADAVAEAAHAAGAPPEEPTPYAAHGWELRFAAAGRHCGHDNAGPVRVLLLTEARADLDTLTRLYRHGSAAERLAVLHSLPHLVPGPQALPLVDDALRTNDTRLVAAAVGPYAGLHLDRHAWRHAVLKCLFTEVPVDAVAALERRAPGDAELARMLTDYAAERTAAGRHVPHDLDRVLALATTPPRSEES
ncbi:EboA domain-containing protein [Streptomyces genisteinicus]|uniref:EboA domain-containing protein n=1 Tax=Streptomyces genisteinicus TaxID=2768068 RepID=A0A7H0I0K2_9ACTN|nr:EboA domain-containing protein [Streptomyces genisteinicus]QNP66318.1 EboA domain-containing protein [Streptomyces genisteinicus]